MQNNQSLEKLIIEVLLEETMLTNQEIRKRVNRKIADRPELSHIKGRKFDINSILHKVDIFKFEESGKNKKWKLINI